MKTTLLITFAFIINSVLFSQVSPDKYWVQFTDKNNSPYSITQPADFLSQRAIDRRINQEIDIIENDLPVNPDYINGVAATGVTILNNSKWFNSVTIYTTDQNALNAINALSYVKSVSKANDGSERFP